MAASEVTRTERTAHARAARTSLSTRHRRALGVAGAALVAAIASSLTCAAQTPDSDSALLQPSLQGKPMTPPQFQLPGGRLPFGNQAPPTTAFTAPSRIGAIPTYGSPNGFGAGSMGFDSMNTPRRKKRTRGALLGATPPQPNATFEPMPTFEPGAAAPVQILPPPPEIYPRNAASRIGASLPPPPADLPLSNPPAEVYPLSAARRPGAVLPIPPPEYFDYSANLPPPTLPPVNTFPLGTLPQKPLPSAGADPYAALGIRAGSFLLLPSLDLSAGYNTNAERGPVTAIPSSFFVAAPELQVTSNWERHSLTADIKGSYIEYGADLVPSLNVPFLNSKIDGTIDMTRDTQFLLENRVIVATDNPGSPNLQAQLAKLPINQDVGGTLGVLQQFYPLAVSLKGTIDRATYDDSQLTNGQTASNDDRNFDQYAGILRIRYDLDPGLKPFVEVEADQRIHDEEFDRNGLQRDSVGRSVSVGSVVNMFGSLTGEMAVGYVDRSYRDTTLPDISGVIANGTLIWQPTGLTTVKLTATSQVYETVVDDASGEFSRDVYLQIDHAFRTWLIGTLKAGYGVDNYAGVGLTDNRYFASVGLTYKFSRELQVRGELRQDWQTASQPGYSYTATSALVGLRLQR